MNPARLKIRLEVRAKNPIGWPFSSQTDGMCLEATVPDRATKGTFGVPREIDTLSQPQQPLLFTHSDSNGCGGRRWCRLPRKARQNLRPAK